VEEPVATASTTTNTLRYVATVRCLPLPQPQVAAATDYTTLKPTFVVRIPFTRQITGCIMAAVGRNPSIIESAVVQGVAQVRPSTLISCSFVARVPSFSIMWQRRCYASE